MPTSPTPPSRALATPAPLLGQPPSEIDGAGVTLDQLRILVSIVDDGSFSAAARRVGRVQSAVSHAIRRLEDALGIALFDRTPRAPVLTPAGRAIMSAARDVLAATNDLFEVTQALQGGIETTVSIVFDAVFPTDALADLAELFANEFPTVGLELGTETLGAVSAAVSSGHYALGVCGPAASITADMEAVHVGEVQMVPVAAPFHPLAQQRGPLTARQLQRHTQVVLSERISPHATGDVAVVGDRSWRVLDLMTKRHLLLRGTGWGNLPIHLAADALGAGALVRLPIAAWGPREHLLSMRAIRLRHAPLGPATTWVLSLLPELCRRSTTTV